MGWRYIIGATISLTAHAFLKNAPSLRAIPHGNCLYDIRRAAGSRTVGPIIDAGANIGQTAWGMTRFFPQDPLYCFEPVKATFDILQSKYGTRATCVNAALGAEPGQAEIKLYGFSELNTFNTASPGDGDDRQVIGVEMVTIDTLDLFCARQGIDRVGILKMDVQGWEMNVLKGAQGLLDSHAIDYVITEVGFDPAAPDIQKIGEINDFLYRNGYDFCGLYEQFRHGQNKEFVSFANALYKVRPLPSAEAA